MSLGCASPPRLRVPQQNIALTLSTYKLGIFHALLDLTFHMDTPHVRSKHRNTGRTTQPAICDDDLKRCAHIGAQRRCACLEHRDLCAVRESSQSRLDQVLLDWGHPPAFAPNIRTLCRDQVDFQQVCVL